MGEHLEEESSPIIPIYNIELTEETLEQLKKIKKSASPATKKRLERIFAEIALTPMDSNGFASPERLKHYPNEQVWSRELSKKDRITYEVFEEEKTILVFRLLGHYNDKQFRG